jgi:uncharacterized protein YciI
MFIVYCRDGEGRHELRKEVRPRHIDYLKQSAGILCSAGPQIGPDGNAFGGLFILNVGNREAAEQWTKADPMAKADVYDRIEIAEWKHLLGSGIG